AFVDSVPQSPPSFQAANRRLLCYLPARLVGITEGSKEPMRHRAMLFPVQSNVPLQIILEVFQTTTRFHVQLVHDALKDGGQQVFSTESERRSDGTKISTFDEIKGLPNETANTFRQFG